MLYGRGDDTAGSRENFSISNQLHPVEDAAVLRHLARLDLHVEVFIEDSGISDEQKSALLHQYLSSRVKKERKRNIMRMLKGKNYSLPEMIATKHLDTPKVCFL